MSRSASLIQQESHFAFGKNWAAYAARVTPQEIDEATDDLLGLTGGPIPGKRFLDVGCGSGIHALAALRLGAAEVVSIDIDPDSVATTRHILQAHAPGRCWRVEQVSVFDLHPETFGRFDIVYSWGVLHHTGDMYRALRSAAALVAPEGKFIFALYRLTWLCWMWKLEKRWYARASERTQAVARRLYVALFSIAYRLARRQRFSEYVANYGNGRRGMDFYHDVHDWLGGWPYESISGPQVRRLMGSLGLQPEREQVRGLRPGLFGSGCDEYVYRHL